MTILAEAKPEPMAATPRLTSLPASSAPARPTVVEPRCTTVLDDIDRSVPVPGVAREVRVKIASQRTEWEEAFRLVAETYRARGYEPPTARGLRFTTWHALPCTTVFVAKHEGRVAATLSLVMDNYLLGLPMESIYGEEIEALRRAGKRLVEVTSLADVGLGVREFVPVFVGLMKLMAQYGISQDADTWVITINPRHRAFYQRVMGFIPLGGPRAYPTVQNNPAEAYRLDMDLLRTNAPTMHQTIFGEWFSREVLAPRPMTPADVLHLAAQSSHVEEDAVTEVLTFAGRYGSPRRW